MWPRTWSWTCLLIVGTTLTFSSTSTGIYIDEEDFIGQYWSSKSYIEKGYQLTFHYRKLFEDEYDRLKDSTLKTLRKLCDEKEQAVPLEVSLLDTSQAFKDFISLPMFKPYLVLKKHPAQHGFYLNSNEFTKAALFIQGKGLYRVEFWSKNPDETKTKKVFPDDIVCVKRSRLPTSIITTTPVPTSSEPPVRCKPDALGSVIVDGNGTSSLSALDSFLINYRHYLLGLAVLCVLALMGMLMLVACVWWKMHVRESDTEKLMGIRMDPGMDLLDDTSSEGLIKKPKVVHVPRDETQEFGAIAARRHRDMMRRSMANMAGAGEGGSCGLPSPVLHYHTLGPRMGNRPAVVTDCNLPSEEEARSRTNSMCGQHGHGHGMHTFCTLPRSTTGPQLHANRHVSNGPRTMV